MAAHDKQYRETLEALRQLSRTELREHERAAVAPELDEIDTMLEKLEKGMVEIAAFGEVNSGKSSLLNALLGRSAFAVAATAGKTRDLARQDWSPSREIVKGFADTRLVMVDTPGINEVSGDERAAIAEATVRYADIILFVTYGDLNDVEFSALKALRALHKPIVLVVNKIDLFKRRELEETVAAIRRKVGGYDRRGRHRLRRRRPGAGPARLPQPRRQPSARSGSPARRSSRISPPGSSRSSAARARRWWR